MRGFIKIATILISASTLLFSVTMGQAQYVDGQITLRVPVQLKKMIASTARVYCSLHADGTGEVADNHEQFKVDGGEFDQVIELTFKPPFKGGKPPTTYYCAFFVYEPGQAWTSPIQAPPGPQLYRRAKPGEFFRHEVVKGQLAK